jgi:hypothetical protein
MIGNYGEIMMPHSPLLPSEERVLAEARALVPGEPPPPWRRGHFVLAGGVQVGGWTRDNFVVIVSFSGYSVTDPDTGKRLIRDRDEAATQVALTPDGLGFRLPTTNEGVPVFGIYGGDGSHITNDGWGVERICPWWPRENVIMRTPFVPESGQHGYLDRAHLLEVRLASTWLRCGFSSSERHLLILGSDGAEIYSR